MSRSGDYKVMPRGEENDDDIKAAINAHDVQNSSTRVTGRDNDDDEDDAPRGPPPKGFWEVIVRIRELELESIYGNWTNWMQKALQFWGLFNIILYYQLDRGGMFKDGNVLDPIEGSEGAGTTVDPREFYAWFETILLWMAAVSVLGMRHAASIDAVRITLGIMSAAMLWLPIRFALELSFAQSRGSLFDEDNDETYNLTIYLVIMTPVLFLLLLKYVWILYIIQSRLSAGEDLPDLDQPEGDDDDPIGDITEARENEIRIMGKKEDIQKALDDVPVEQRVTIPGNTENV